MNLSRIRRPLMLAAAVCVAALCAALAAPDAGAQTSDCHFAPMAGVVDDTATRLSWQQSSSGMTYNWDDAAKYCSTLDLNGMGWRLPTVKELHTLVDPTKASPAADAVSFPDMASEYYWSSSQVANFGNEAWAVSFGYGYDGYFDVHSKQRVRCVR